MLTLIRNLDQINRFQLSEHILSSQGLVSNIWFSKSTTLYPKMTIFNREFFFCVNSFGACRHEFWAGRLFKNALPIGAGRVFGLLSCRNGWQNQARSNWMGNFWYISNADSFSLSNS